MEKITACSRCSRLRKYCASIAEKKKKAFADEIYWGKPVPGFGDPKARIVMIGLAPAAHGANRTGRIFTGDQSGRWLYRALHRAGLANQPTWENRNDGLELTDAYVTCVVHCAPPDNKPKPAEIKNCGGHLKLELEELKRARVYVVLGKIALDAAWGFLGGSSKKPKFQHLAEVNLGEGRHLICSYHPSQQNTFTGRLTESMFDSVFSRAKELTSE